jgi:hypothetical protein
MFKLKKWLWTKLTAFQGPEKAYANYLAHFNQFNAQAGEHSMQAELKVEPMSKEAFLKVWQGQSTTKSCGSKGCCG